MLAYFDQNLWDSTLPSEAYRSELKGKKLLLVGVGWNFKYAIIQRIRALGVGHIAVLDVRREWYMPLIDGLIEQDPSTPIDDRDASNDSRIRAVLEYMHDKNIEFDGIWTFSETCVISTAQIASFLGKPGIQVDTVSQLKNKRTVREWLLTNHSQLEQGCPHTYTGREFKLEEIQEQDFPLIAKGTESFGKNCVNILHSSDTLHEFISQNTGTSFVIEHYFEGTDIDLNLIVQHGKIVWSGFVENFVPLQPGFNENGSRTCNCISPEEQAEIIRYSQNILDLSGGLHTACLHVEFRVSHENGVFSFILIEINFRLGGSENFIFHLGQDNHDLILSNLELAFGMDISQKQTHSRLGMYPFIKTADLYGTNTGVLRNLQSPTDNAGILEYLFFAEIGNEYVFPPRSFIDGVGWIIAGGETYEDAEKTLEKALHQVVMDIQ